MSKKMLRLGVTVLTFFFLTGLCSKAWAQVSPDYDAKRGWLYFKMGGNSIIASSPLNAKFNLGFGGGYQPHQKVKLYVEPSLTMNLPQREVIDFGGFPLRVSTKTVLADFNGTYVVLSKKRLSPYVTGGIGLLRNSASLTDGYQVYNLGADNHFTKNLGGGVRVFLRENFFVGGETKRYWTSNGGFRTHVGTIGFTF